MSLTEALPRTVKPMAIDYLSAYPKNARLHSAEQIDQIAASIREFGFTAPILIDEAHTILAGHGRLEAAKRLGLDNVPVLVLEGMTEEQKRAYVLADNKLALNATWDEAMLREELAALQADGFETSLIGFNDEELAALLDEQDLETLVPDDTGESHSGARGVYLILDGTKIPMTQDECERLTSVFDKYCDKTGSMYGFANFLADGANGA